ncbi:MAG: O-antigen ligase family protein, partial [Candidatus Thermoplasmatota archaeon]|nr:O-antigen ligase family protein [Candidatus Thermoplasmatota archaeon]
DVVKGKIGCLPTISLNTYAADELILRRERATPTPTPTPILEDRSSNIRLNVEWPRALRAFYKNPLLGTGYSSITLASDNDYLRALGETGILGLFAFLLIFLRIINEFLKKIPLTKNFSKENLAFMAGLFGGMLGLFINAMFIDIFEASKLAIIFWFLMGLSIKLLRNKSYE